MSLVFAWTGAHEPGSQEDWEAGRPWPPRDWPPEVPDVRNVPGEAAPDPDRCLRLVRATANRLYVRALLDGQDPAGVIAGFAAGHRLCLRCGGWREKEPSS